MSLLEVTELRGGYGQNVVIDRCSMTISPGEVVVIMGGSGSGKSTFLKHLIGLKPPMSGLVSLSGEDLYSGTMVDRYRRLQQIGVAFQMGALVSSLSIFDNVALPLRETTNLPEDVIEVMVRLKLEFVELLDKQHLLPSELSGGMLKRAAVARALARDPKLVFMDEPSAGLDPVVASALDELILKIREALGISVVVVTHELESAFKIASRIVVLDRGFIIFDGSVDQIRGSDNPRIQALINRTAEPMAFDPQEHYKRIMGTTEG